MEFEQEVERSIGFRNEALADKLRSVNMDKVSDEYLCKIGIVCALSKNEENNEFAKKIMKKLHKTRNHTGPYQLIQWLLRINQGYDIDNLTEQLLEWSDHHSDEILYSRVLLFVNDTKDSITQIESYIRHLEIFYDDTLAWIQLGHLYMKEKAFERAAFAYEEAIGFVNTDPEFYQLAAQARIAMDGEENRVIARKFLSKALLLDLSNLKIVDQLIELDGPNKEKLIAYRKTFPKTTKTE